MKTRHILSVLASALTLPAMIVGTSYAAEMRGLWVDAFHPGFKTPEQTTAMIAKAKDCHFNALFVQVRKRGDVYYRSSIEPMARDAAVGYDPLADVIAKAHTAGLEVHAWISTYEVYLDSKWSKPNPAMVHLRHPDWVMRDEFGKTTFPGDKVYLDAGQPEVNQYLVGIVEEIVKNYNIDGIHLDSVRYLSQEGGYNEASVLRFNKETARTGKPDPDDDAWCTWRRTQVNEFVSAVYQKATSLKPTVRVSASVFANKEDVRQHRFQDWESWMQAGILDFVVPMVFSNDLTVFQAVGKSVASAGHGRHVYLGQGGYDMGADDSLKQIALARQAGFRGVVVYSYHYCSSARGKDTTGLMDALRSGPFAASDTQPTMSWKQ